MERELRLFISSTFRDMQEEREYLVKKVFPEIRALCRERGGTFTEVDLRWGITEQEAEDGEVIRICLEEIDRCRPCFIGILGERYGWQPGQDDTRESERLIATFPFLREAFDQGRSVTDMEILYGVLNQDLDEADAFFYFRSPEATPHEFRDDRTEQKEKLAALKDLVRESGHPLQEAYRSPEELGEAVRRDMRALVEKIFPQAEIPTPLQEARREQEAFTQSRRRAYVPDLEAAAQLDALLDQPTQRVVISGPSGVGKSSFVTFWADRREETLPDTAILRHYVGAVSSGGNRHDIMLRIIEEIRERYEVEAELPSGPEDIDEEFSAWLAYVRERPMIILLDAANQLDEDAADLHWLPDLLPPDLSLVVTTIDNDLVDRLGSEGWGRIELGHLDTPSRRRVVEEYLGAFRKKLPDRQVDRIVAHPNAALPLYLRAVLEELRIFGEHESLGALIDTFLSCSDTDELFERILERLENDFGASRVSDLLGLIHTSRAGLTETELINITGTSRLYFSRLLPALDYHLMNREGRLDFFHDFLRRGVERRYLGDPEQSKEYRRQILEYVRTQPLSLGSAREQFFQLRHREDHEELTRLLGSIDLFMVISEGDEWRDLIRNWRVVESTAEGNDIDAAEIYRKNLDAWEPTGSEGYDRGDVLLRLGSYFMQIERWQSARTMLEELLATEGIEEDRARFATILLNLGSITFHQGETEEALDLFERGHALARTIEEHRLVAGFLGNLALLYSSRGEHRLARNYVEEQLEITRTIRDRRGEQNSLAQLALYLRALGETAEAVSRLNESLTLARNSGDNRAIFSVLGNLGTLYLDLGDVEAALQKFREVYALSEELGYRRSMGLALGHIGTIHQRRGDHEEAGRHFDRMARLAREIDNRRLLRAALGRVSLSCYLVGDYASAERYAREEIDLAEELGEREHLGNIYALLGAIELALGNCGEARVLFLEQRRLALQSEHAYYLGSATGNLGCAEFELGEYGEALAHFREALEVHRKISAPLPVAEWLVEIGRTLLAVLASDHREMPDWVADFVEQEDEWRGNLLEQAEVSFREALKMERELDHIPIRLDALVGLARIEAIDRKEAGEEATTQLRALASDPDITLDDEQRAECHYWLWALDADRDEQARESCRASALSLYRRLVETTPKQKYRRRIDELERVIGKA